MFHSSGCQTTNDRHTVTLNIKLKLHKLYGYLHSQIHTDGNRKNSVVSDWTKVTSTKLKKTEWRTLLRLFPMKFKVQFFPHFPYLLRVTVRDRERRRWADGRMDGADVITCDWDLRFWVERVREWSAYSISDVRYRHKEKSYLAPKKRNKQHLRWTTYLFIIMNVSMADWVNLPGFRLINYTGITTGTKPFSLNKSCFLWSTSF